MNMKNPASCRVFHIDHMFLYPSFIHTTEDPASSQKDHAFLRLASVVSLRSTDLRHSPELGYAGPVRKLNLLGQLVFPLGS